jgi:hypothetical protein
MAEPSRRSSAATREPTLPVERSPFDCFELPTRYADVAEVMRIGVAHARALAPG